jgi:hypothetical protein
MCVEQLNSAPIGGISRWAFSISRIYRLLKLDRGANPPIMILYP